MLVSGDSLQRCCPLQGPRLRLRIPSQQRPALHLHPRWIQVSPLTHSAMLISGDSLQHCRPVQGPRPRSQIPSQPPAWWPARRIRPLHLRPRRAQVSHPPLCRVGHRPSVSLDAVAELAHRGAVVDLARLVPQARHLSAFVEPILLSSVVEIARLSAVVELGRLYNLRRAWASLCRRRAWAS